MCELDIIFNFEKAYFMLDEFLLGGEVQETSKKNVLKAIAAQDLLQEVCWNFIFHHARQRFLIPHALAKFDLQISRWLILGLGGRKFGRVIYLCCFEN